MIISAEELEGYVVLEIKAKRSGPNAFLVVKYLSAGQQKNWKRGEVVGLHNLM